MNRNIKLTIEYDGTNFQGWQIQPEGQRTVQGEIEGALQKIFKKKIKLIGSGRTDSGVHALGQVGNFVTQSAMSMTEITKALNANLPKDIAITEAKNVPTKFHAQYSAKTKTYRYTIFCRENRSALKKAHCLHYPHKLNVTQMRREASALIGRKDFKSFQAADAAQRPKNKSTIRTIKRVDIQKKGDYLYIEIEGNGFLYKMVRNIVGTLLSIGRGSLPKGSMRTILLKKDRNDAGDTAKAKGLSLIKVKY